MRGGVCLYVSVEERTEKERDAAFDFPTGSYIHADVRGMMLCHHISGASRVMRAFAISGEYV